MSKATLADAYAMTERWAKKFGFGGYTFVVTELPKDDESAWGKSVWLHDDDHFEVRVRTGHLPKRQMEALVIHELTHGLLTLAEGGREESVCNRLPRLLLGEDVQTANIWALGKANPQQWNDGVQESLVDPLVQAALPLIIDDLPPREQTLVNAVYWEGVSLSEVARRLGISRRTAGRLHKSAMTHLKRSVDELQEAVAHG